MKKNQLSLFIRASLLMLAMVFVFAACKKDDDDPVNPVIVEDGLYIRGEATPYTALNTRSAFVNGINEANNQTERNGMFEKYTTLKAGSTFEIVEVEGTNQKVWGPTNAETVTLEGQNDQIRATIQKGSLTNSGSFTVPTDGMYHIIIDKPTNTFVIAPVAWGIIGGFSGWSNTEMPLSGGFNANNMKWEVTGLVLRAGEFKYRYSDGWKIELAGDSVKANTNFGGVVEGTVPNLTTTLVPGGPNYAIAANQEGVYTATITWTPENGYRSTLTRTGDAPTLEYPTQLYVIGDAVGGWDWNTHDKPMIPVNSQPHLFWKILWLEADGGFKFAPEQAWGNDFGKTGDINNDIYGFGTENIPAPATSGYYMVTVNYETREIAITQPMVYLIGATVGGWTEHLDENKFTVDNENGVLTITKVLEAGEVRMYAWMDKGWFSAWWQSEFIILNGEIVYRGTGGDQERVNVTAGNTTIRLNFREETGSITGGVK